ncbi:uncharacterized protein LOC110986355 [Acanthaster planci]|uniref:Uncharacterized protein LOC110986355 n=1 Tax=Acanthaster planci TaxID=133434 RepID=A0A8B7ZG62_ACAPL|nr:uncharacterized protein LOC110986355 [Acanthaster planci]XP_022103855.1 uncharacterized protein LOC110986355 [Acanthaster planci]
MMAPNQLGWILFVSMATVMPVSSEQGQSCPVMQGFTPILTKPSADLTLGLMLNLHQAGQDTSSGALCNFSAETTSGSLLMKAAAAAADNWPDSIQLAGLSVGLEIYDLCDTFQVAEYSVVRFANERYDDLFANGTVCRNRTLRLGVVGFRYSSWSESLAPLLQPLDLPAISFTATSTSLSNAEKYPNFFRTLPPDSSAIIMALVDILKSYGWTYSAVVHSDDTQGMNALKALEDAIKEAGFCLTKPIRVGATETRDHTYDAIVNDLIQQNISVVLLWALPDNIRRLFLAVERIQGAAYDMTWLSGNYAPLDIDFSSIPGNAKALRGLFVLSPFVDMGDAYKTWLAQWYPNVEFNYGPTGRLIDAIHAYIAAFSLAHQDKCGGQQGVCEALANIQGSEFIDFIKRVNFTGIDGRTISFDKNGDPAIQVFDVLQFKSTSPPNMYYFQTVGEWNSDQGLTLNKSKVEFYSQGDSPVDPPTSVCPEGSCFDPRCQDLTEFIIHTLLDLHGSRCDSLSLTRFNQLEAIIYALHKINQDPSLLPDVHISIKTDDICGEVNAATKAALELIQGWDFDRGFPNQEDKFHLLGTLHSASSRTARELSKVLQVTHVPVIDNTATSPTLSDKNESPNFLRTISSDVKQAEAMVDLLASLNFNYIQTINSKGDYGDEAIKALKASAKETGICIANSFRVDSDTNFADLVHDLTEKSDARVVVVFLFSSHARALFQQLVSMNINSGRFQFIGSENWGTRMDYIPDLEGPAKGALTVTFKSAAVREFEDFVLSQTPDNAENNPYFNEYWMDTFKCNLPGAEPRFSQNCTGSEMLSSSDVDSLGVEDFINSVYVYAVALSNLIRDTCPDGRVCDALFDVPSEDWIEHLRAVDFISHVGLRKRVRFDENGDGPAQYSLYQFIEKNGTYQYDQVGEWTSDGGLILNKTVIKFYSPEGPVIGLPQSLHGQGFCVDPVCRDVDGRTKFVIEALFDIRGSKCNTIQENWITQAEAANFAVREINCNSSLLPGVQLSMTVNDICGDTAAAGRAAFQLAGGWGFISGGFPSQGNESYLLGMLHSGSSGKAITESKVLQVADVPLIASSATSPALSDRSMFGNFLRTVPSDIKQAAAMVDLLTALGLTYIQTIHTMGAYGEGGIKALKEAAKEKGICIANSHVVDSDTNFAILLNNILAKPEARTLILFLIDEHARALFGEMDRKNMDPSQFQIVASDTWGARTDYIPGLEDHALGALTVSPKASGIPEFEEYFLQLTPETHDGINPFFNEYWAWKFKCNLPGGETLYNKNCTGSEMLSGDDVTSLGMENIINVIHAYANALSNLINKTCPDRGVCDAVYGVSSQDWFDYLRNVTFISQVGSKKMVSFAENGDGAALYSLYQLKEMNNRYQYEQIGFWDDISGLSNLNDGILDPVFSSKCTGLCLECNSSSTTTNITSNKNNYFRISGDLDFPVVLQLSESGEGVTCGDLKLEESLVLASLLYALDKLNANPSLLPGVKLGVTVVDSCGNPAVATRRLVGLLGDFVSLESTGPSVAVLGPANPDVAEEIAHIVTSQSKLPMISHGAVSPNLSSNPRVLSTSAPYTEEVAAIIAILKAYDWDYVGAVHSATPYGKVNNQEFQMAAREAGICIGPQQYVNDTTDFQKVINDFSSDKSLNVIVAFVSERHARSLLFADKFELTRRFVWVGTDTWDSLTLVSGLENTAKGMLVVASDSQDLPEIQDYFSNSDSLRAASLRDPYLRDYLQEICPSLSDCQLENQLQESLKELSGEIVPLVNALYVAAHGVNLLHDIKCGSSSDELCKSFYDSSPDEKVDAIRRVTVESGAGGKPFLFNGGSVPAAYSIKNYQYNGQNGQFLVVGEWHNNQLSIRSAGVNLYSPDAEEPQRNPSGCYCGPVESQQVHVWRWIDHGIWATVVLALSGLCGVFAVLIAILFLSNRQGYIVQSASFSLSVWLLFGIILMYLLNLTFMFEPNTAICGIRRFGISFVYCVVYASMLAKSIRANRFARKKPGVDMNFAGSWSQSLLFLAFLLPEGFLIGEWLILIPPSVRRPFDNDTCAPGSMQTCGISNIDLTIFMMYAYFLVLVTFFSSFGALNSPHAQHEGKSISVSSLFSILILTAWACVLHLADPLYGIPGISIGLTADATIILVFMFLGKVGALTKKEEADTGNRKVKNADVEDRPEKVINVYENAGATAHVPEEADVDVDEQTQF